MSKYKYKNILLTGAAGALGNQLRETLSKECDLLRISDKENLEKKFDNEEVQIADLASAESILKLTKDIDCIVHMGGQSIEGSWDNVLNSNIIGMYNLYEACRKNKIKREFICSDLNVTNLKKIIRNYKITHLLNFAALKHVRSEENFETLNYLFKTNLVSVFEDFKKYNVPHLRKIFFISTDKTAYPGHPCR